MRKAGILMPISSLPSPYGVGDFGESARKFIDLLVHGGFKIWQILPLNPLGYGNSPYQPYSSNAMDEIYISLDELRTQGLLKKCKGSRKKCSFVDYQAVREEKEAYLRLSFLNFEENDEYKEFIQIRWVYPYAVYLTLKKANKMRPWNEWPLPQQQWIKDHQFDLSAYQNDIAYEMYLQFMLYQQWLSLKKYANDRGIEIMGDIPIYVGIDSEDVWSNQKYFLLDKKGKPTHIAGVPPDYFSTTGQRWGNPLYHWKALSNDQFGFWVERLRYNAVLYDLIRIDHFRAFDTYWKIPATCETAIDGKWMKAPGYALFDRIFEEIKDIEIIAEDLGDLRKEVYKLRDHYHLKGMKIVQFTFHLDEKESYFVDRENMVIYTGTHDNATIRSWYQSQKDSTKRKIRHYFKELYPSSKDISESFIRYTLENIAEFAIIPMQDLLNLGNEGRMNVPGTIGSSNWEWRLIDYKKFESKIHLFHQLLVENDRI